MTDTIETDLLALLRETTGAGTPPGPAVRSELLQLDDPKTALRAGKILEGLPPEGGELRPVRVGILATCTIGSYPHLLRTALVGTGALPTLEPGTYGMFEISLATAAFAENGDPDVVSCLLDESYFLPEEWDATDVPALEEHLATRLADLRQLLRTSNELSSATLLVHTLPLPARVADSIISRRARTRLAQAWHRLNADILALADDSNRIEAVDLAGALAENAVRARDDRLHAFGDLPYTDGALLVLAHEVRRFVQAKLGLSRKVLALDLDNTLWGGVLGEVGAEGVQLGGLYPGNCYQQLQRTVARLRDQGVVLALASKNDAEPVEKALTEHPEMLLRPESFSATAVNWRPKAGNLRAMADSLDLATGSFVFMDDSPFERGQVAAELPEVALVPADGDPAHLVRSLLRDGWFDVIELTATDRTRPELYRTRARRNEFSGGFGSSEEYLHALGLELTAAEATAYSVPRIAQLAARTNQFNLTGIRYDEPATAAMSTDPAHLVAAFSVRDRFGDEGITGAAWVERGADTWRVANMVLSCRVLGRGVELAIAGWLADRARTAGAATLQGRFVPSGRNGVAGEFWAKAGFTPTEGDGVFELDLTTGDGPTPAWINVVEIEGSRASS
ncbi:HAD-IIIC family phosphatase [Streptomyces sioyaensis]|uniref:HAD-IIIC family phosphatase n=1 Tax=Streptomyces sioyaensis TaxID=67364 RepID=UPI00378B4195